MSSVQNDLAVLETGPYVQSSDADTSTLGDRVVVYHRGSRSAIVLNPTGSWIWKALAEPRTASDLVAELRRRFPPLPLEDAQRDVACFLGQLLEHALVAVRT